eukprot:gene9289-16986_t
MPGDARTKGQRWSSYVFVRGKEIASSKETFILSSLWQAKRGKRDIHVRSSMQSFLCLLILMSGDIESCPGPYSRDIPALKQLLKQRGLAVFHQNVRGLFSNINLVSELFQSFSGIDILTLSETHIRKDSENNGLYDIPGYSFESRPRNSGKGGGVGAYISNKVPWDRREDLEDKELEIMWIKVWPSREHCKGILIAIIYRPPDSSKYLRKDFNARFNSLLTKAAEECKETMILGDANINFRIENDNKELKAIFSVFGLKQIIAKPTRISETTETLIDVILTNNPSNIAKHDVIPTSIGDHDMPGCVHKINNSSFRPRVITCRDYKMYNPENMKSDLQNVDWAPFYNQINVNEAWSMMKSILQNVFNHHAPRIFKKVRGKPAPWLNSEVKRLMNERDKLLRKSRRTKNQTDISAYKCMRNKVNTAVRKAKSMYHKDLLKENSRDPNKFWKTLESIYPTKSSDKQSPQSFEINGDKVKDPSKIANAFCSFFANIVTTLKEKAFPLCNFTWRNQPNLPTKTVRKFMFRKVSKQKVERELKSIKRNKATGLDDLPPGLIKDSAESISAPLTHLINMSLMTSTFPADWKAAKIIPTHKSGARSNCDNYRPISVLPILSKARQSRYYLERHNELQNSKMGHSKSQYLSQPQR